MKGSCKKGKKYKFPYYLMLVLFMVAFARVGKNYISVSNSVSGRELPIYSVKTDKKQVALSFDAACADGNLRKEIKKAISQQEIHRTIHHN